MKFHSPEALPEALKLKAKLTNACFLGGGTDLLVDIRKGLMQTENFISLQKIKALKKIETDARGVQIGAMVTCKELASSKVINQFIPALAEVAGSMSSTQIRSMATIGGNIASAVPSADLPPPLIAVEASLHLSSSKSSREIALSEFFAGPRKTICQKHELLTFILIPPLPPGTGMSYQKFTLREANSLAVSSAAARLTLKQGIIDKAIVVLGAVGPTPLVARKTSAALTNEKPSESLFKKVSLIAREESQPITDIRGSIWFRKELVQALTFRALNEALRRTQKNSSS